MFALGIRYLRGVAVATSVGGQEEAEWPPHPARVFMAMAAAHFETSADPEERAALEWLEAIEKPPSLFASDADRREITTRYVPVNDRAGPSKAPLQGVPGLTRARAGRTFPTVRPINDSVYLIWSVTCPEIYRSALAQLCGKVTRIGHSSSFVQMWVTDQPPDANWLPNEDSPVLRVRHLSPGLLRYLEECAGMERIRGYAELDEAITVARGKRKAELRAERESRFPTGEPSSVRPTISIWKGYSRPDARPETVTPPGLWEEDLIILRLEAMERGPRALDLATTLPITQRLHEAVLAQCPEPVPEYVSGHTRDLSPTSRPHLAYLPLAFVGATHADGLIRGLGVAIPRGLSAAERRLAIRAVASVGELVLGPLRKWALRAEDRPSPPSYLDSTTWSAEAGTWGTVTPIAFDRHSKEKTAEARDAESRTMIAEACGRIGLPAPESVTLTPVSPHLGVPASHEFPRMRRKDGSQRRHTHAILVFPQPVCGPMLLGAGRYRGYGLCRPLLGEAGR